MAMCLKSSERLTSRLATRVMNLQAPSKLGHKLPGLKRMILLEAERGRQRGTRRVFKATTIPAVVLGSLRSRHEARQRVPDAEPGKRRLANARGSPSEFCRQIQANTIPTCTPSPPRRVASRPLFHRSVGGDHYGRPVTQSRFPLQWRTS